MKKMLVWLAVALCLCAAWAGAAGGGGSFPLRFDEGFTLSLPEGWVSYPAEGAGIRYVLGDGSGGRFLYVLAQPTELSDFEALQRAVEASADCDKTSQLELNGQAFAAFVAPGLNASGCSTLLNGELLTFLFTPQDDSEYMLTVAEIMDSFRTE